MLLCSIEAKDILDNFPKLHAKQGVIKIKTRTRQFEVFYYFGHSPTMRMTKVEYQSKNEGTVAMRADLIGFLRGRYHLHLDPSEEFSW